MVQEWSVVNQKSRSEEPCYKEEKVERTVAGVEWLTPIPDSVPGSFLSRGAFRCCLEQVAFPQLLR